MTLFKNFIHLFGAPRLYIAMNLIAFIVTITQSINNFLNQGNTMSFMKIIAVTACLFAGGLISSDKAFAASSGWMDSKKALKFNKRILKRGGNIPTSIRCKNNPIAVGMNMKNTMLKIEYRPNPKKQGWSLSWGAGSIGSFERKYRSKGFVKVSSSSFRRKSGLIIPCAVYHRKLKK